MLQRLWKAYNLIQKYAVGHHKAVGKVFVSFSRMTLDVCLKMTKQLV